jgi:hypothetical protein
MHASETAASPAATTWRKPSTRLYYTIRAEGGFLAASHAADGPPITTTSNAENATRFVDITAASRRAAALQQLGWRNLRVIAIYLNPLRP